MSYTEEEINQQQEFEEYSGMLRRGVNQSFIATTLGIFVLYCVQSSSIFKSKSVNIDIIQELVIVSIILLIAGIRYGWYWLLYRANVARIKRGKIIMNISSTKSIWKRFNRFATKQQIIKYDNQVRERHRKLSQIREWIEKDKILEDYIENELGQKRLWQDLLLVVISWVIGLYVVERFFY